MKKLMMAMMGVAAAGCCCFFKGEGPVATAVSPDGRNEIRLWTAPLAYEVVRDGVVVAAKAKIGLKVDGRCLCEDAAAIPSPKIVEDSVCGKIDTPVYKKASVDLRRNETFVDFGDWGLRLAARDDGVAYRFETKRGGEITVDGEKAAFAVPCTKAKCLTYVTRYFGSEEVVPKTRLSGDIKLENGQKIYPPFVYSVGGKTVAVTESDVRDYPCWYFGKSTAADGAVTFDSTFAKWPKRQVHAGSDAQWRPIEMEKGGRWVRIKEYEDFLVKTPGTRTFPWRTFILADAPSKLCEADIVYALAAPKCEKADFSWVKPGKVAWDWWNDWNLQGPQIDFKAGCNTKTYEYYIDFAQRTGVEYVIFDEGWSEKLNIWKFHPDVDVPHLIDYANKKGVGIILWMAWAQVYGEEEKVAEHFAKLGAKGFKVDFMDRADADEQMFLEKFAKACQKHRMLIDYHGATRPTGLSRKYPNVLNYEGIHGLEVMKFYHGEDMMDNDVKAFFGRLTAGPMDYTPGAMLNYPIGRYAGNGHNPGSVGTRCRQIAMMSAFEAPLQMLCDSPTNYEKNMECFSFMAATPVTWDDTIGLGGCPDSFCAVARRKGSDWWASGLTNVEARDFELDTAFLGEGRWNAEIFRDAPESEREPMKYVHEKKTVAAGDKLAVHMARGGGFAIRFSKAK